MAIVLNVERNYCGSSLIRDEVLLDDNSARLRERGQARGRVPGLVEDMTSSFFNSACIFISVGILSVFRCTPDDRARHSE